MKYFEVYKVQILGAKRKKKIAFECFNGYLYQYTFSQFLDSFWSGSVALSAELPTAASKKHLLVFILLTGKQYHKKYPKRVTNE